MTVRTIAYLKERFQAGDKPTQDDFWDLFETMLTLETWPNPLPASSAELLTNIPIPDPLPAVSGEFLTNINRSDWIAIDAVPTYATPTSFVVTGDYTGPSYFVVGRRIRIALNPSGYYFGTVTAAVFSAGTTTVTVDETIPTSALASVDVNMLVDSDIVITSLKPGSGAALAVYRKSADGLAVEPWAVPAASDTASGLVELATTAEAQALTDAVRAVTPAGLAAAAAVLATANRLMLRDAAGRAQVVDPSAAADIATKNYTDGQVAAHVAAGDPHPQYATDTDVSTHAGLTAPHSAVSTATASRLVLRDAAGRAQVADPSAAADIATKGYTDAQVATKMPTFLMVHTWTIPGEVKVASGDTDYIVPFYVRKLAGHNVKLHSCVRRINSGASATVKLQKNGVDVTGFTGLTATTTTQTAAPTAVTLADLDMLALVVTAVSGTPKNMTVTVALEYSPV